MPTARNDDELRAMLLPPLRKAAEYTADKILELNKQKIETWVYGKYTPKAYSRTGEFKDAWETNVSDNGRDTITAKMDYAPDTMSVGTAYGDSVPNSDGEPLYTSKPPETRGRHVSVLDGYDARKYLAEIIYEGKAGDIFGLGEWTRSRNAFKYLDRALGKTHLHKFFEKGMRDAGLKFTINNTNFIKRTT